VSSFFSTSFSSEKQNNITTVNTSIQFLSVTAQKIYSCFHASTIVACHGKSMIFFNAVIGLKIIKTRAPAQRLTHLRDFRLSFSNGVSGASHSYDIRARSKKKRTKD